MTTFGYAQLKKYLSRFHHFSFKNPRKGRDFTRSQKSAITRQYNKLASLLKSFHEEKNSFIDTTRIPRREIPKHDGVKTNKGFFFKYPYSNIQLIKKRGYPPERIIVTDFRKIEFTKIAKKRLTRSDAIQYYFYIPPKFSSSLDGIIAYRDYLEEKWQPDYVLMSADKRLYATQIDIKEFFSGSGAAVLNRNEVEDEEDEEDESPDLHDENKFFTGIILGFFRPK